MRDQIASRLAPLAPDVYEFADESHLHIGHAGNKGGGHYAILVVSSRVTRQRQVQTLLQDLFTSKQIHALSIIAQTPDEYFQAA